MADSVKVKETLDAILEEVAKTLSIKSYELLPDLSLNAGNGFAASFYTGVVRDKLTGRMTHVVIKRNPSFAYEALSAIIKNEADIYGKLIRTFTDLQKEFQMTVVFDNTPRFFCTNLEPKNEYIAMEYLKPAGYVMADKEKFIDEEHWKMVFQVYGRFHALSFALREQRPKAYQAIKDGLTDGLVSLFAVLMEQMKEAFAATLSALMSDEEAYHKLKKIADDMSEYFQRVSLYRGKYNCITHGDCSSNNLLFKYSKTGKLEDVKLIDFQLSRESTPVHDLSYLFYSSASKEDLNKLDKYLTIYHKSFSRMARDLKCVPEKQYPLSVLKQEWKQYGLFGVYMGLYWKVKLLPKSQLLADSETQAKFTKELYEGPAYRTRVRDLILHAVDQALL